MAAKESSPDHPEMSFAGQAEWARWLDEHHGDSRGVWLRIAKAGSGQASVSYAEALEEALRYGWIDGQKRAGDAATWLQKFTPRGKRSIWSKINREKAEALIESGRMHPAGLAEVDRAKADGRWEAAYASASQATVPEDLQAALDANPKAKAFFETISKQNRYAILFRTQTAKKPETRARRIEQFVRMLEAHETIHP